MQKLINKKTNHPLVEFEGDKAVFYNKFLEQEMRHVGIVIPHGLRGLYHGKDCVFLGEPDFQKAFREIYYLVSIDHEKFKWLE